MKKIFILLLLIICCLATLVNAQEKGRAAREIG
jgi:hypothetical protein